MKQIFVYLLFLLVIDLNAQRLNNYRESQTLYRSAYLDHPAVYLMGKDSCQRFYFTHFTGFDSLLQMLVRHGDTAKFIRLHFSFVIDKHGVLSDAHFKKIAATAYGKSRSDRELIYFRNNRNYWKRLVKRMLATIGFWKPGLLNGKPVDAVVDDYMQFWIGLNLPGR